MMQTCRIAIVVASCCLVAGCACLSPPSGNAVLSAEKTVAATSDAPSGGQVGVTSDKQ